MTKFRNFIGIAFCVLVFSVTAVCQCPDKVRDLNWQKHLEQLNGILERSIPEYKNLPSLVDGYFIFDLTEPSNSLSYSNHRQGFNGCISFVDRHVYHFSVNYIPFSQSHIAFFNDGKFRVFENINCEKSTDKLENVISFAETMLKSDRRKDEILVRLKNYRRYGSYKTTDEVKVACGSARKIPENSEKLYNRSDVLRQFADVLRSGVSEKLKEQISWRFFVEESRANGFFVWDLTEPANKQTSLLERVEFKNNHIYHFGFIDAPFSFSNIAVLEDGKLKFFKNINCSGKGDRLKDVFGYLNQNLEANQDRKEILKRVKNYRKFGVYASYNGLSKPQCKEALKIEK